MELEEETKRVEAAARKQEKIGIVVTRELEAAAAEREEEEY